MRDVLEQACKLRKWSPESYALKTQTNKTVDLSQPFRLSGLAGGAKLTLVQASRSPSVVNVALQLPDSEGGGRLSDKFASTTSLWLVLRKYEDAVAGQPPRKLNLTQRGVPSSQSAGSGRLEYEQPCLHLMGRNLESFVDLQKTLAQLGLNSGSVLIRLSFKSNGQPLEEAMQEIEQYFKAVDATSTESESAQGAHAAANGSLQSAPADVSELDRDSPMPDADVPNDEGDVATSSSSKVCHDYSLEPSSMGASLSHQNLNQSFRSAFRKKPKKNKADSPNKTDGNASIIASSDQGIVSAGPNPSEAAASKPEKDDAMPGNATSSVNTGSTPTTQGSISTDDATTPDNASSMPGISVYRPPSNSAPAASLHEEDPRTFEPSIDHAKAHQAALTRLTQNKRLASDKELAEQAEAQQAAQAEIKTVVVRVKYPDESMIETRITPATTAQELYAQVNDTLASADAIGSFQLRFTGNKGHQLLPDVANKRLVRDFGFKGRVLVTIVWSDGASAKAREGPSLKAELRNVAQDLKVDLDHQRKEGEASHKAAMDKKPTGAADTKASGKSSAALENKLKKMMGFGRK